MSEDGSWTIVCVEPPPPGWRACVRRPDGTADFQADPVLVMQMRAGDVPHQDRKFRVLVATVTGPDELTVIPDAELLAPGETGDTS